MDENSKASDFIIDDENIEMQKNVNVESPERSGFNFFDFLRTPTGEGSIDDYINNPLNFNQSKSIAQILRGMSGFLGALNYAIFDLIIGTFNFTREFKKDV